MTPRALHGDCLDLMRDMAARGEVVQAIITDPPYGLEFMGRGWDGAVPGVAYWRAAWALLPPGGHLLAFGGTRTFHRLAVAIEDAGFELRDVLLWLYGTGFPKSRNLSEAWAGWGTALKPAWEPIILARKPLAGTVAANVQTHGAGALNVDGCRIPTSDKLGGGDQSAAVKIKPEGWDRPWMQDEAAKAAHAERVNLNVAKAETLGRWPANVVHDGSDEVEAAFAAFGERTSVGGSRGGSRAMAFGMGAQPDVKPGFGDTGTVSRFFYCAKASKAERAGSKHPTVKPVALMRWLVRLVTPPGGLVLDPFAGSGSTLAAAVAEGFGAVGIEQEAEYIADMQRRFALVEAAE